MGLAVFCPLQRRFEREVSYFKLYHKRNLYYDHLRPDGENIVRKLQNTLFL